MGVRSLLARAGAWRQVWMLLPVVLGLALLVAMPARAADVVDAVFDSPGIDVLPRLEFYESPEAQVRIALPADAAGNSPFMALEARATTALHRWAVLHLANPSLRPENLVVAVPHQKFAGSGVLRPRIPGSQVVAVQTSSDPPPQLLPASGHDAFAVTVAPGQTLSLAFELGAYPPVEVNLWHRADYDFHIARLSFFRGATIGIAALLGLAIVCLFILRPVAVFPAAALFAWPAILFLMAQFGYLPATVALVPGLTDGAASGRAVIEALMLAGLLSVFVTFPALRRRLPAIGYAAVALAVASAALAVFGWFQPLIITTIVRIAFAAVIVVGLVMLGVLARRRAPRVRATLVAWLVLAVWTLAAGISAVGIVRSAVLSTGVSAGLVLAVMVMTIIAARFAFHDLAGEGRDRAETSRRVLALSSSSQSVWDWLPETGSLHVGPELERALGHDEGTLSGDEDAWIEHIHPDDRAGYSGLVDAAAARGHGSFDHEFRLRRRDGAYRWYQLRARALDGDESAGRRLIGVLGDVTAWRRSEDRILSDAVRDRVTGLPNRALLVDRLERAMRRAAGAGSGLHVLVIDLDRFRSVNEGLGHEVADSLLNIIGRRLSRLLGPDDTLARMPGDQFAIIFDGADPPRQAAKFADEVRADISQPVNLRPREIFITATIGVAAFDGTVTSPGDFLRQAEIALFEAKRRGKDLIEFFRPDMLDERSHLISLEHDLHRAMQRGEIEVVYQPIMRLADGELAGFEALVRWRHPHHGLLEPAVFMGLAEETGIVRTLGRFVLEEAVRQVGIWKRAFRPSDPLFVSVNVSFAQLLNYDLVDEVRGLLAREAIPASTLKLEITESLMMENPELTARVLQRMSESGVTLACDDFGSGYSSLVNLHRLPFDTLKIDRTLIDACDSDAKARVVLDAIVAMAHGLGLSVVAEGIETEAQMRRVMALGCDLAQGYLVGRPVTARQIAEAFGGVAYAIGKGEGGFAGFWRRLIGIEAGQGDQRHPAFPAHQPVPAAAAPEEASEPDDGPALEPWAPSGEGASLPDLEARARAAAEARTAAEDAIALDVTGLIGPHKESPHPPEEIKPEPEPAQPEAEPAGLAEGAQADLEDAADSDEGRSAEPVAPAEEPLGATEDASETADVVPAPYGGNAKPAQRAAHAGKRQFPADQFAQRLRRRTRGSHHGF